MKKSVFKMLGTAFLTASLLLAGTTGTATVNQVEASALQINNVNQDSVVVFYVPHQDDEVLTFGVAILNHVQAGHEVHVVLLTDGGGSVVRKKLGMSREAFSEARDKEFAYALQIMGVKPENIHYKDYLDGQMTVDQARNTIAEFEGQFQGAKHKTFSEADGHSDHKNAGIALRQMSNEGLVSDARYYLKRGDYFAAENNITERKNETHNEILRAAATPYQMKNQSIGFYGIGYMSVSKSFELHKVNPLSRYHK